MDMMPNNIVQYRFLFDHLVLRAYLAPMISIIEARRLIVLHLSKSLLLLIKDRLLVVHVCTFLVVFQRTATFNRMFNFCLVNYQLHDTLHKLLRFHLHELGVTLVVFLVLNLTLHICLEIESI